MTDPTPHARRSPMEHERDDAPDLVERVARQICAGLGLNPDDCVHGLSQSGPEGTSYECHRLRWQEYRRAARAAVALVLKEATLRIEVMPRRVEKLGGQSTSYVQLGEVMEELHAMMPEEKPHE